MFRRVPNRVVAVECPENVVPFSTALNTALHPLPPCCAVNLASRLVNAL